MQSHLFHSMKRCRFQPLFSLGCRLTVDVNERESLKYYNLSQTYMEPSTLPNPPTYFLSYFVLMGI
jgi:hypothetical protein